MRAFFLKKFTIFSLLLSLVIFATANTGYASNGGMTVKGHVACFTEDWLDDIQALASYEDVPGMKKYLISKKCTVMKGGLRVKVTDGPGFFGSTAGFEYYGIKLWTDIHGIEYD